MLKNLKLVKSNGYDADSEEEKQVVSKLSFNDMDDLVESMQSKAKVSTLQDGLDAFVQHLTEVSQKRISYNLPEINRRLDSLARLLEQGSTCAAVCFSPEMQAILVATNTIHSGSHASNAWIKQIEHVFKLISACHLDVAELIDVLAETIVTHVKHEERHLWAAHKSHSEFSDPNEYVAELLKELFRSGLATKDWRDQYLVNDAQESTFSSTPLYKKIIRRASRITRDFLKLRESLHNNQQKGGSGAFLFFNALKV
ncbi:MAG: hypothetical protein LRY69_06100 [Gammaproteobacteria bacterium]|nr:hypothetical protein [Gammaproteobacteria bacterium]